VRASFLQGISHAKPFGAAHRSSLFVPVCLLDPTAGTGRTGEARTGDVIQMPGASRATSSFARIAVRWSF
jgi:hypothetical protein